MSVIPPFLSVTSTPSVRTPSVLITVHAKQVLLVMENGARVSKMNQLHPQNKILFVLIYLWLGELVVGGTPGME